MFKDQPIFQFRGPWGIPVQIGASLILLAFIFLNLGGEGRDFAYSAVFFGLVLLSIFLHELGHAFGCRVQGVPVTRIMIYGGGGFCQHRPARTPREDELIVIMGPIVNAVIWAVCVQALPLIEDPNLAWGVSSLMWINGVLALLNLIPVMPLDGGRLFQLLLQRFLSPGQARRIAGGVGLVLAVLWVPAMIFVYLSYGMALLFNPPIAVHWRMVRGQTA